MADIKTRDVVKGTIKKIDKAAIAADRMRSAYVQTKEKAEHTTHPDEHNAEEYASDRVEGGVDRITHEAAHQFDKQGRKGLEETKRNVSKAKDGVQRFREKRAAESMKRQTVRTSGNKTIKAVEQTEKTIKQSAGSAGKKTIKTAGKGTAKAAQRSVKTTKTAIKTTQQAAKAAQKTAQATVKASQKAAQAAKAAAKATVAGVKAAVKATIAAVKAIIAATKALVAAIAAGGWVAVMMILVVVLLGCALALFGGNSGGDYQAVSAEVEAYTPYIRQYAEEYGIGEYVELIKAVMMQESGGKGTDPMQCSECGYNTTGGYIQDPILSINWGIHTLADSMNLAGVESPIDMEHIRLALQGYNYGPGYIYWAIRRYGGYDVTNALEFSENMKAQLGTSVYGDPQYVYHVLRYYPYGRALNRIGDQTIVEVAASQLGNVGGEPYWSWYGFESRVSWCACFVSWCADQCGYIDAGIIPKFSGCVTGVNWFRGQNRWLEGSVEPNPGMIIFFDWDNKGGSGPQDGLADHVGIVQSVENGIVYTIEGNSGDSCRQNQYPVGHYEILGYGVIAY